jgi:hypothetical protein
MMERRIIKGASARSATAKRKRTAQQPGAYLHGAEDRAQRYRIADELNERRAKPNPMGRPPAAESSALRALRAMLAKADGAEAIRIGRVIEQTEALYKPSYKAPQTAASEPPAAPVKAKQQRGATYHGTPCRICGGTLRYLNSRDHPCVPCHRVKVLARVRRYHERQRATA